MASSINLVVSTLTFDFNLLLYPYTLCQDDMQNKYHQVVLNLSICIALLSEITLVSH